MEATTTGGAVVAVAEVAKAKPKPSPLSNAGKGRRRGARNKTTLAAKEAIAAAAAGLGGVERLVAWAKEDPANERLFWGTIYPKLLPLNLEAEIEAGPRLAKALVWRAPAR